VRVRHREGKEVCGPLSLVCGRADSVIQSCQPNHVTRSFETRPI
jgi:hypothetical protein